MDFETIIFKKENHIATITMNRPEVLNALSERLIEGLAATMKEVEQDDDVRVMVLTGAGRGFCAGQDVRALPGGGGKPLMPWEEPPEELRRFTLPILLNLTGYLRRMSKPTIAMVNGVAAGAGFGLALSCDMRIGSEKARFVLASNLVGLVPPLGLTWLLPRILGYSKAAEIVFTGRPVEADEAERMGILNKVVSAAELETETIALAEQIAKGPPIAIKLSKQLLYYELHKDLEPHLQMSAAFQTMCHCSQDHREGVAAWREKREPRFQGR
ncbi:MAG: enoyl-CoA hydratase/isomerase family protein [Dehalococcoidia bacterium]|nr:enoyl-CoA hydratase/isomerase family protein [Dehalococcoidia bacterium]